jgi:integrase
VPAHFRIAADRRRRQSEGYPDFMGHSKIQTTFDIYGHLLPGSHDEVRERMDAYLAAG